MDLEAPIIVGIVFISMVAVIKIISDSVTRRKLIEKGMLQAGIPLTDRPEITSLSSLKWGMLLLFVGVAAIISQQMPRYWSDEGALGLLLIAAGLALLIYFPISQKRLRDLAKKDDAVQPPAS